MINLFKNGAYLLNGRELVEDNAEASAVLSAKLGQVPDKEAAKKATMAYGILEKHNVSGNMKNLQIKFDKLISHDITFVGIIQTARASGLEKFPMPYVLTNCHNSLCAVGGTINEDDHMFGLTAAQKYGGIYVPPHQAVIHQYAREMLAGTGDMILGSDSHTRYGALGTMAIGEGGGELAKQLLGKTYDIAYPKVIAVYLTGTPNKYTGPMDIALAIVAAVYNNGYVKNTVMEFVGPGVANMSMDYRIGVDVMTTETTCLTSIWETDVKTKDYFDLHFRSKEYSELKPGKVAYYDGVVEIALDQIKPMIAMPFHPSCAYTIDDLNANMMDILDETEKRAKVSFGEKVKYTLKDKVKNGRIYAEQALIAGCAGGGFENITDAADILRGKYIGDDKFTLSVYPASTPIYMEMIKNGVAADLLATGAIIKTAFCGPCFGAGDTPANNAFSIRHSTRNFPNREGSKLQSGQLSSVAIMDARSIAATAANKGYVTAATEVDVDFTKPKYYFDRSIYEHRVYDSHGVAHPEVELQFGPNIKDWPEMPALTDNVMLKVVSEIHDPVTTTDELIPSGETSSLRSNPIALSQYALSRKDPEYVPLAKEVQAVEVAREKGECPCTNAEFAAAFEAAKKVFPDIKPSETGIGTTIYAVKPGDGSAREQAASCQKVLGGWANIASAYATKRYRSNCINWGLIPFLCDIPHEEIPFHKGDIIYVPDVRKAIAEKATEIKAYIATQGMKEFTLKMDALTDDERQIIIDGCLINFYKH